MARQSAQHKLDRVRPPRVQITYDVEVGGAIEIKELPFVVGVLGDFTGNPEQPLPKLKDRKFVEVNPDNFDTVLEGMKPHLSFCRGEQAERRSRALEVEGRSASSETRRFRAGKRGQAGQATEGAARPAHPAG